MPIDDKEAAVLPEFKSFDAYVEACGYSTPEQKKHIINAINAAITLMSKIVNAGDTDLSKSVFITQASDEQRKQVFCGLAWFAMLYALDAGTPLHKGMFIFDLGQGKNKDVLYKYITDIKDITVSQIRPSSHFEEKLSELPQYGITPGPKYFLPGPAKKEHGLDPLTTGLVQFLDEGSMTLKLEDYPFSLFHPKGSYLHTKHWVHGVKVNNENVIGRREDAMPMDVVNALDKFVENFDITNLKPIPPNVDSLKRVCEEYQMELKKIKNITSPAGLEAKRKLIFKKFDYMADLLDALENANRATPFVQGIKEFNQLFAILKDYQAKGQLYGEETRIKIKECPNLLHYFRMNGGKIDLTPSVPLSEKTEQERKLFTPALHRQARQQNVLDNSVSKPQGPHSSFLVKREGGQLNLPTDPQTPKKPQTPHG